MLLKTPKLQSDIITIPPTPADIRFMKGDDVIFYEFNVVVDLSAVIQKDSYRLVAKVFKSKPKEKKSSARLTSARRWKKKTKRREKLARRAAKKRKEEILASRDVDLTRYISNDLTNAVNSEISRMRRQQVNSLAALSKTLIAKDPFTSNVKSSYRPTTPGVVSFKKPKKRKKSKKNLSSTVPQGVSFPTPASSIFSKKVLKSKKDPASITTKSFASMSTILPKTLVTQASSFVFSPPTTLVSLPAVRVSPRKKPIRFMIRTSKSALASASSFYLKLELETKKGVKVDEAAVVVPHARILNNFITPSSAPRVEAEYIKDGVISVRVDPPSDKKAKSVKVFRRLAPPEEGGTDTGTPWQIVYNSVINSNERTESVFRDTIATSRPVLYRAVVYGENSKPSEEFSSTVVLPLKKFKVTQTGALTAVPKIKFSGQNPSVSIAVKDIPDDVVSVMLKRFDLTTASDAKRKASTGRGFVYVGQTPAEQTVSAEILDADSTVEFLDQKTKTGRTYSYVPVGVTRTGKKISGSTALFELPLSPARSQVSIDVTSPKVVSSDLGTGEIQFTLSARFTEFGFSEIRNTLESSGQKSLFDNDLLQDRDKFEKLISFLVERRNSRTGEEESFGVVQAGDFSDGPESRREKNVKPLEPGTEYTYTFTALIGSAEELFPTLTRPDVDLKTLRAFSRRVSKFRNPLSLKRATLQSTSRQADRNIPSSLEPTDPLVAGRTDVQKTYEVRFPLPDSIDETLRIEKYRRFDRLVWRTKSASKIDHFKIYVLSSGGRVLIDTVHCDDSTSEFYYRHRDNDYAVGYQYMIVPIDLSYKEMSPIYSKRKKAVNTLRRLGLSRFTKVVKL